MKERLRLQVPISLVLVAVLLQEITYLIVLLMVVSRMIIPVAATARASASSSSSSSSLMEVPVRPVHPVVIVPGSGGNQLEARLNTDYEPSSLFCKAWHGHERDPNNYEKNKWYRIWFDPTVLIGPFTKCFSERMMLYYDPVVDDYRNAPGVETRVPHFGSTESIRYLDPSLKPLSSYMAALIESLEQEGGGGRYVENETLFGAPYDFRYGLAAPGHPSRVGTQYLEDLKLLIERASNKNKKKPVIIVSHSLGGLFSLHLLLRNSLTWRRRYVKHLVALSTPWGGTVQEMLTFASGYTLGVPLVDPLLVRDEQRSSESNLWLMPSPSPDVFGTNRPLVITPTRNYTAGNIEQFLNDLGNINHVRERYVERVLYVDAVEAPKVPVTCVVGTGVKTPETLFYYGDKGFDEQPQVFYGDGDGTVNMVSLLAHEKWWGSTTGTKGRAADHFTETVKLSGMSHTDLLRDKVAIHRILGIIRRINSDSDDSNSDS